MIKKQIIVVNNHHNIFNQPVISTIYFLKMIRILIHVITIQNNQRKTNIQAVTFYKYLKMKDNSKPKSLYLFFRFWKKQSRQMRLKQRNKLLRYCLYFRDPIPQTQTVYRKLAFYAMPKFVKSRKLLIMSLYLKQYKYQRLLSKKIKLMIIKIIQVWIKINDFKRKVLSEEKD